MQVCKYKCAVQPKQRHSARCKPSTAAASPPPRPLPPDPWSKSGRTWLPCFCSTPGWQLQAGHCRPANARDHSRAVSPLPCNMVAAPPIQCYTLAKPPGPAPNEKRRSHTVPDSGTSATHTPEKTRRGEAAKAGGASAITAGAAWEPARWRHARWGWACSLTPTHHEPSVLVDCRCACAHTSLDNASDSPHRRTRDNPKLRSAPANTLLRTQWSAPVRQQWQTNKMMQAPSWRQNWSTGLATKPMSHRTQHD